MKILPKLKSKLENAKTLEEKKQIFLDAGIELDEKELEKVDGGIVLIKIEATIPDDSLPGIHGDAGAAREELMI